MCLWFGSVATMTTLRSPSLVAVVILATSAPTSSLAVWLHFSDLNGRPSLLCTVRLYVRRRCSYRIPSLFYHDRQGHAPARFHPNWSGSGGRLPSPTDCTSQLLAESAIEHPHTTKLSWCALQPLPRLGLQMKGGAVLGRPYSRASASSSRRGPPAPRDVGSDCSARARDWKYDSE